MAEGLLVHKGVFMVHEQRYRPQLLMAKIKLIALDYNIENYQISI